MDAKIATGNLVILHSHPNLDGIDVAPDGVTLVPGTISPEKQQTLLNVINQTFVFAEEHESKGLPPLCVTIRTRDEKLDCYPAGYVLNHLQPPQSTVLESRKLSNQIEKHRIALIECADGTVEVDSDLLGKAHPYFGALFGPHFKEGQTLKVVFNNYATETARALVDFLLTGALPPPDENILELLDLASRLDIKPLKEHLIQQLTCTDLMDGTAWRSLLQGNPHLFYLVFDAMSDTMALSCLKALFNSPTPPSKAVAVFKAIFNPFTRKQNLESAQAVTQTESIKPLSPEVIENLFVHLIEFKPELFPRFISSIPNEIKLNKNLQDSLVELINSKKMKISNFLIFGHSSFGIDLFTPAFCQKLRVLDLKGTRLANKEISLLISRCPNLQELVLPRTVSGPFLNCLNKVKGLKVLDISACIDLDPDCLKNLKHVPELERLVMISFCNQLIQEPRKLKLNSLRNLMHVPRLKELVLRECYFELYEEEGLGNLRYVPGLETLDISSSTGLARNCLDNLDKVPGLKVLNISRCQEPAPNCLGNLDKVPGLKVLNISGCHQLAPNCLGNLDKVPGLKVLNISDCTGLAPNCLDNLHKVPGLETLDISSCTGLAPNCLDNLLDVTGLQYLNISYCRQLDPNCLDNLLDVTGLQYLNITYCRQLDPNCLRNLRHTSLLQHLIITGCYQLAANCLDNLLHVPRLLYLEAHCCKELAPNCLDNLRHVPGLLGLNIIGCNQVDRIALDQWYQRLPGVILGP